jgi:hypothetical protein
MNSVRWPHAFRRPRARSTLLGDSFSEWFRSRYRLSDGAFTPIDFSGAITTHAVGINLPVRSLATN